VIIALTHPAVLALKRAGVATPDVFAFGQVSDHKQSTIAGSGDREGPPHKLRTEAEDRIHRRNM